MGGGTGSGGMEGFGFPVSGEGNGWKISSPFTEDLAGKTGTSWSDEPVLPFPSIEHRDHYHISFSVVPRFDGLSSRGTVPSIPGEALANDSKAEAKTRLANTRELIDSIDHHVDLFARYREDIANRRNQRGDS